VFPTRLGVNRIPASSRRGCGPLPRLLDRPALCPIMLLVQQLLLEVGTEEVPGSFVVPAVVELERRVRGALLGSGIAVGSAELFCTPRRLALRMSEVAERSPARVVEVQGPPKMAAFDAAGRPTKAGIGFSAACGRTPEELYVKETPRGEYVFAVKEIEPVLAGDVLRQCLAGIIAALPFPKTMRWDSSGLRFARPIRWLLCLLGTETIEFNLGALRSSAYSLGLRHDAARTFPITHPADYEAVLASHGVCAAREVRRRTITEGVARLAGTVGGAPVEDEELLDENTDITESPEPLLCSISPDHLALPAEVLITALKKHQRCFAVRRADSDELLPYFVAVANTPGCDRARVAGWYEKAAESRLRDAGFFVEADLKRGLAALVEEERQVTWIEGLGSYYDKTGRLRELCRELAGAVLAADPETLDRAALLCKADLLTNMVREKEFTSLQGRIGGIYARRLGEPAAVAEAVAEHYLPRFVGDRLPSTPRGALLSIADKLDNIVAAFIIGQVPSGSEDPYALRRQATGLLSIILRKNLPIRLDETLASALRLFPMARQEHAAEVSALLRERLSSLLVDYAIPYDLAAAVMETSWQQPAQALLKAKALAEFRTEPDFARLIIGQKRVANILKGQAVTGLPDATRLAEPTERQLWSEARRLEPGLDRHLEAHEYGEALRLLLGLRPTIDRFFDDVLVMAKEEDVRLNRLRLLAYVRSLFGRLADLSKIVSEGE